MADLDAHRFGGLNRLFGPQAVAVLARSRVAVIGIGGVGSWTVEGLARSGVGQLTLIDLDDVCITNTNRQLPALHSTIGQQKVDVMADRVRQIWPECQVVPVNRFFTAESAAALLSPGFDFVVDAVDRTSIKALIIAQCQTLAIPCVTVGSAGGKRGLVPPQIADLGRAGSDDLLKLVRRRLRRVHGYEKGDGEGTLFGVDAVFSPESMIFPWNDGTCRLEAEPGMELKMDCASGFGAASFVTGQFGLAAAGAVVRGLLAKNGVF